MPFFPKSLISLFRAFGSGVPSLATTSRFAYSSARARSLPFRPIETTAPTASSRTGHRASTRMRAAALFQLSFTFTSAALARIASARIRCRASMYSMMISSSRSLNSASARATQTSAFNPSRAMDIAEAKSGPDSTGGGMRLWKYAKGSPTYFPSDRRTASSIRSARNVRSPLRNSQNASK